MRFETWSKEQKQELDLEYQSLFGGQIPAMKKLFKTKSDVILFDELLENVSANLFRVMQRKGQHKAESLIERMHLSQLDYDVLLFNEPEISEYEASLYFYNHFHVFEYVDIRIKDVYDMKKLIRMIMHVGHQYKQIIHHDQEGERFITDLQLLDGFDLEFISTFQYNAQDKKMLS